MTDESTDKLLREFLLSQRQEEKRRFEDNLGLKRHVSTSTDAITKAFQSFSQQLTERFDRFEVDQKSALDRVERKADTAHALALGVAARVDRIESGTKPRQNQKIATSIPPMTPPPWELGSDSPTGMHRIIPIDSFNASKEEWSVFIRENLEEHLEVHDKVKDGETWRWLKENATKLIVAVLGTVIAAAIIANLIVTAQKNTPPPAPPTTQH